MKTDFESFPSILARSLIFASAILAFLLLSDFSIVNIDENSYITHRDDAFINFRAAKNLHDTGKPYINIDEPVASNSSIFYTWLISPVFALPSPTSPIAVLLILSIIFSIATALLAGSLVGRPQAPLVFSLIMISPPFLRYGISAWEHIPQAFFVTLAFALIYRGSSILRLALCVLTLGVAFMMRPDTAPLIIIPAALCIIQLLQKKWDRSSVPIVTLLLISLAIPIAYGLTMEHYYNSIFPNTYILKATAGAGGWEHGLSYVSSIKRSSFYPIILLLCWLCFIQKKESLSDGQKIILASLSLHFLYIISIGGDAFQYGRFFMATLPIIIPLFFHLLAHRQFSKIQQKASSFFIIAIIFSSYNVAERITNLKSTNIDCVFCMKESAVSQLALIKIIEKNFSPDEGSLGVFYLGTLPYYMSDYHVVDFLGKADPVIARTAVRGNGFVGHNKWDFNHSFGKSRIVAIPMSHPFYQIFNSDITQEERTNSFYAGIISYMRTRPDYVYLSPQELCLSTDWGLYVETSRAMEISKQACKLDKQ